jgi:transcriptional regulator with XRE-family HTH domain
MSVNGEATPAQKAVLDCYATMASHSRRNPPESNQESLGIRLALLRKQKGLTQIELAEKVGSIQVVLSDYERGKLRPNPDMLVRLARALDVTTDELLGLKSPAKTKLKDAETLRLWKRFQQFMALPERDRRAVLRLINSLSARPARRAS